jgi:hypothetical protein
MDCYSVRLHPANKLFRPFPSPLVQTLSSRLCRRIPHKRRTMTVALHHMPSKVTSSCLLPLCTASRIGTITEPARQVLKGSLNRPELACTRFRRHRVRCFDGAGGGSWRAQPAHSCRIADITRPAGRSVKRTGARGRTARPQGPSATCESCRAPRSAAARQAPSPPSGPAHAPSRGLLLLLLQQQLDALSDEGRGLPVPRERDQRSHEVPRRLIHAEGDDS